MKRNIGPAMLVSAFGAVALTGFATPAEAQTASASWPHYSVIRLGTLGGSSSNGYGGVSNNGSVAGDSFLQGDRTEHAFLWRDGVMTDLATLGGLNSSSAWPQKNSRGLVAGVAEGSQIDPLKEYWGVAFGCNTKSGHCEGYKHLEFGFRWQNGVMTALPTLGGNNGSATGDNDRDQVVGGRRPPPRTSDASRPNSCSSRVSSTSQQARSTSSPHFRATSPRRPSGSMTTATWWACRGLVGPPTPRRWAFTPWFGEMAQSSVSPAWEA
jgi:probable HAF family extracellular repeat protein